MSDKVALVRLRANNSQYDKAMRDSAKITEQLQGALGKIDSKKLDQVGSDLTRNVTVPLLALGGFATKASNDFDAVFTKMQTLAGVTAGEVDGLKESIFDLAAETGRGPTELAEGLYFLRSSGLDASEAMDALRMSARASAAGLGSTAVVADAVSSAMNAYAAAGLTAAEATDVLIATARAGKAEPEQLAQSMGRILPIASELGVTFQDVGGSIAALSLSGNDAAQASTLLTNVLQKILKPSQQGAEALEAVGLSAGKLREMIAEKGLLDTLVELREKLGTSGFVKLFEDAQAVQGVLALTGQNLESVRDAFDEVNASAGVTESAFATWGESMGAKNSKAWAELQTSLIRLGDSLAPIAADLLSFAASVATAFGGLPEPIQKGILAITGLTVAFGPFLKAGAAGIQVAQGMAKAWDAKRLESFRLGLMGVTEAGAGAGNKLGGLMGTVARSPVAWTAAAGGVTVLTAALVMMAQESERARRNAEALRSEAESSGKTIAEVFREQLAATMSGTSGGIDLGGGSGAFELFVERMEVNAADLAEVLSGSKDDFEAYKSEVYRSMNDAGLGSIAGKVLDGLNTLRSAQQGAIEKEQELTQRRDELGIVSDDAAASTDALAGAHDEAAAAAAQQAAAEREVVAAVDAHRSAADAVTSAEASAAQARRGVIDAERGVASARKGVESATRAVTDAERGLADAQRAAADASAELADALHEQQWGSEALEDANRGVVDAEKALAAAQRESKDAQDALNDARATAAERLRDLEEAVGDSALDEEGARIALARAQERQSTLGDDGRDVSALDRREAALNVAEAEARLREVLERNAEMEAELAEAREKGVDGSDEVTAAQERITESAEAEKEAQENLTEAQERVAEVHEEMATRVTDAQRRVEEANLRVQDASMRVRDAVDQVGEAQQRVVDATGAVVEARGKVEEAERGVLEAMAEELVTAYELEQQLKANDGALEQQIARYDELAGRLEPGSALRTYIEGLRDELIALEGQYNIDVALNIGTGVTEAGDAVAQGILDILGAARRASGGPVFAGSSYLVGDRTGMANAEVFTPGTTGRLTPVAEFPHMTASADTGMGAALADLAARIGSMESGGGITMGDTVTHVYGITNPDRIGARVSEKIAARVLVASP